MDKLKKGQTWASPLILERRANHTPSNDISRRTPTRARQQSRDTNPILFMALLADDSCTPQSFPMQKKHNSRRFTMPAFSVEVPAVTILPLRAYVVSLYFQIAPLKSWSQPRWPPKIHSESASKPPTQPPIRGFVVCVVQGERLDSDKFRRHLILSHIIQPWGQWALSTARYRLH